MIEPTTENILGIGLSGTGLLLLGNYLLRTFSKSRVEQQRDGAQVDVIKMQRDIITADKEERALLESTIALLKQEKQLLQEENRLLREEILILSARVSSMRAGRGDLLEGDRSG